LAESVVAAFEAEALAGANLALELELEAMAAVAASPQITVNVSGNVISEYDLAQTIIDQQYQYQRSGGNLTYNTIAI
jgi:cysteinyl-tRNA synthetase